MVELQTILEEDIPVNVKAIIYIGRMNKKGTAVIIEKSRMFSKVKNAVKAYKQQEAGEILFLMAGETFNELILCVHQVHGQIKPFTKIKDYEKMEN